MAGEHRPPAHTLTHSPYPFPLPRITTAAKKPLTVEEADSFTSSFAGVTQVAEDAATPPQPSPIKAQTFGLQGEGDLELRASSSPRPLRAGRPASRWGR